MASLISPNGAILDVPDQVADDYLQQGYRHPGVTVSEQATPDESWTVKQLDAYAIEHGIDVPTGALKAERLALLLESTTT